MLFDTSVGYAPPNADPNDDGIDFLSPLTTADVIDTAPGGRVDRAKISAIISPAMSIPAAIAGPATFPSEPEIASAMLQARNEDAANALKGRETKATFKLKSMTREFSTPYDIQVTDVKIPTGYNLEAV